MDNEPQPTVETAREGDPLQVARLLVSIPSVNPALEEGGQGEAEIAEAAARLLDGWGLKTELQEVAEGRPNVVARLDGTGPTLLLNGHLDTVGVGGMSIDPFDPRVEGDRLRGRGSCDMKGGVAALMAAAARLAADGPRPNLVVLLTADEEHASVGMSGWVSGAKRPPVDLAVVCEPTGLQVMPAHKGFVWIRADFRGRAAHGSRPEVGIDAIRHAGLYLARLDEYAGELGSREPHPLLGHASFHAGTVQGGSAESVYPDRCELVLERRTLPGESGEEVLREFQDVLTRLEEAEPTCRARLTPTLERPGTEVPRAARLVQGLLHAASEERVASGVGGMSAWVDAAFLNEAGVPAVCFGPGSIEQAHTEDEWISVRQIRDCASVLERFARALARS